MMIKVKLFAMLQDRLPPGAKDHTMEVEVEEGATPQQVVDMLRIPPEMAHLVLVDGLHLIPAERNVRRLLPGETLAIFPPVAGG